MLVALGLVQGTVRSIVIVKSCPAVCGLFAYTLKPWHSPNLAEEQAQREMLHPELA